MNNAKVFAGNANPKLALDIAKSLKIKLGKVDVDKFSDAEIRIELNEPVRQENVFIIQPTCAPANDNLMEFLIMADAIRRSAATKIIGVVPYYGYARQDRRPSYTRTPVTSRLVADMIQVAGVDQLIVVDLHSEQQQGFFTIPTTNISAAPIIVGDIWRKNHNNINDVVVVSPDTGGVARARAIAKQLNDADLVIIDKRRPKANVSQVMNVIGDVEGKDCIVIDDMIDTAGTLAKAAAALKEHGAKSVVAYATHPVFSGNAYSNIEESVLDEVVVTDTIPLSDEYKSGKIRVISIANLLAETMRRINSGKSVSEIYM
ncbi:MAG: ribose-phosphate pyrophosphokinase [Proteobacteria bacterium]|nr:ribose-phosphate pyrophosphokinase [Pseudomonadota bacterium]